VVVVAFDCVDGQGAPMRQGITVNSFTSVSLDPPLVLVSLQRTARSHDLLSGRAFSINILGAEQEQLARHFAGRPAIEPRWLEGSIAPCLADVVGTFQCLPWAEYDGGDHTLFLGEVVRFTYRTGDTLGFSNGRFVPIPEGQFGEELML